MNKNIFMMSAGRAFSAAGRAMIFQVGLIACYIIFVYVYTPNIKLTDRSISLQLTESMAMRTEEYTRVSSIILYTFGLLSMINLTFIGIVLINAGKYIQRHWKYFGVQH